MVYSPLGEGKLVSGKSGSPLWSKKEKYKATEAQLALAWLLKHLLKCSRLLVQRNLNAS